ncbi:hypothetical protein L2E82_37625 [Cichorium intybus]|uniref:Uncharacterized protein n=1 Tax=Cichorium intybus TaxID=13427 RepID=A0ACB9AES4_CICIN|nr:hypothetical protein L2E82_37625 [Cichorium intybus]
MPAGKSRAHVPLYWHILCESLLVCRQLLDFEYRLTQPDVLKQPGSPMLPSSRIANPTVPTPTVSLEHEFFLKELFLFQHELQIQSEYAPMQQHPSSYRVHAYRATVRNTSSFSNLSMTVSHPVDSQFETLRNRSRRSGSFLDVSDNT